MYTHFPLPVASFKKTSLFDSTAGMKAHCAGVGPRMRGKTAFSRATIGVGIPRACEVLDPFYYANRRRLTSKELALRLRSGESALCRDVGLAKSVLELPARCWVCDS
jgi:hypothetical protein